MSKDGFIRNDAGEWVFRVHEDRDFTRNYEVAAWYSIVTVPAGEYPVTFTTIRGEQVDNLDDAYYANAVLDGRRTYDYFPSLYGGVAIGGGDIGERDEPDTYHVTSYAFSVRDKAAA